MGYVVYCFCFSPRVSGVRRSLYLILGDVGSVRYGSEAVMRCRLGDVTVIECPRYHLTRPITAFKSYVCFGDKRMIDPLNFFLLLTILIFLGLGESGFPWADLRDWPWDFLWGDSLDIFSLL